MAMFLAPSFFTTKAPITEPCWVSDVIMRNVVLKPWRVYSGAVAMAIWGMPARL
ncbi:hypothetical protein D3C85_1475640 [compost metagenome]